MNIKFLIGLGLIAFVLGCQSPKPEVTPEEARRIAKEAYIYGFPLVDNMRVQYAYFIDKNDPDYKAPYNILYNIPRVFTSQDKAIQTANSDTPYSWIGLDLRTEPIVFTVPPIEKDRYWSLQLIDLYTHNFDIPGTRTDGNNGGSFLIAGPNWKGEIPEGITRVIRCETEIASAQFRTQLFDPADLENVKKIQEQYIVKPLSAFINQPSPKAAPEINFPKPLTPESQRTSLEFFNLLNFYLQFCPTHPSEKDLREQFAKIGLVSGKTFDAASLSPEIKDALSAGIEDAWKEFDAFNTNEIKTGKVGSAEAFGTREHLNNNYMFRMAGAVLGIYGLSKEEAIYPIYQTDSEGQPLNAATNKYTLTMKSDEMPPVNAFWSYTMYELPARIMTENPINRYLINSAMLPNLKRNPDNSITIYIQHESPGKDKESNWLPAPNGPFFFVNRLYLPKPEALNGTWKPKPLVRVQ
ncbi:DUF1254 domain-containing protein [Mariniradius sediminis]|uniref:DUF1254 domain-containing protein n=1 Tax=Mariniradius sediminis TaxID=2909237 RepID=A0ABS9BXV8_9BACT|nr:DUF1254 domain-containing protein [Mariniradius sediminis]MCF1752893.1 DUF1254 domain-containing protein [Mariniradius sediminis]